MSRSAPFDAKIWIASATPALAILLFAPGMPEGFEFPKAALVRLVGAASILLAAFARPPGRMTRLDMAAIAWLATEVLSTALGASPSLSLVGEVEQQEGLLTSLGLAGLYLAARLSSRRAADVGRIQNMFLAAAAVSAIYALLQAALLDPFRWGRLSLAGDFVRPFGTSGHANVLGVVMSAAAGLAAVRTLREPEQRWWSAPLLLLCVITSLLTVSRGAWLGTAFAVGAAFALVWFARGEPLGSGEARQRRPRWPLLLAGTAVLAVVGWLVTGPFGTLLGTRATTLLGGSGSSRLEIWRAAWDAFLARPWLGSGPDAFRLVFPAHQTMEYWRTEWGGLPVHAHDVWLHALATRGALGVLAAVIVAVLLLRVLHRRLRSTRQADEPAAATLAALAGLLGCGVFGAVGIAAMAFMACVLGAYSALEDEAEVSPGERPALAMRAALSAAAVSIFALSLSTLVSGHAHRRSLEIAASESLARNDVERLAYRRLAAAQTARAARWAPLDDEARRRHAEALIREAIASSEPRALVDSAEGRLHEAVSLAPSRAAHWQRLAGVAAIRLQLGDEAARAVWDSCYARAHALSPADVLLMIERTRTALRLEDVDRAQSAAAEAVRIAPWAGPVQVNHADVEHAMGRDSSAVRALVTGEAAIWVDPVAGRQGIEERRRAWGLVEGAR